MKDISRGGAGFLHSAPLYPGERVRLGLPTGSLDYIVVRCARHHELCYEIGAEIATGRTRLWSTVRSWNTPSFRVLDKLGFQRDHVSADDQGELVWLTRALP